MGPECASFLIEKRCIGRFLHFYFGNDSPYQECFTDFSEVKYKESFLDLIGGYYQEKESEKSSSMLE